MGVRKKNRRKIRVRDRLFLWWIEESSDEGLLYLNVVADDNKQHQFYYSLYEADLATLAESQSKMPLPDGYDRQTRKLSEPVVRPEFGGHRHALATPALVRRLIEWHADNVW